MRDGAPKRARSDANLHQWLHLRFHLSIMLRCRLPKLSAAFRRAYATAHSPHALVFIEQRGGVIDSGSLSALTAAEQLGGSVTGLIVGGPGEVEQAVETARK